MSCPPPGTGLTRRRLLGRAGAGAGAIALGPAAAAADAADPTERVSAEDVKALERRLRSRRASNGGVRLHYEIAGKGPLVLFIHGFPGWSGVWRHQMAALVRDHTVAAVDLRGYNLSDKPVGADKYGIGVLLGDMRAVVADTGRKRVTVVAHDWGGGIAWILALTAPEVVERLVILNSIHPWSLARALHDDPRQQAASKYAQELRRPDALDRPLPEQIAKLLPGYDRITPEALAAVLARPGSADFPRHLAAMRRTSIRGALNYYTANYPAEPYPEPGPMPAKVRAPTLLIHGREDPFLLVDGLNDSWDLVRRSVEIRVIAGAGHFVQDDARDAVNAALRDWLARTPAKS